MVYLTMVDEAGITRRDQGDSQVVKRGADTLWFEYEVYGEESVRSVIASQRT